MLATALLAVLPMAGCGPAGEEADERPRVVVYSGRNESLAGPLFERLEGRGFADRSAARRVRQRALMQADPGDRAPAMEGIDPLDQQGRQVLDLRRGGGRDGGKRLRVQSQRHRRWRCQRHVHVLAGGWAG